MFYTYVSPSISSLPPVLYPLFLIYAIQHTLESKSIWLLTLTTWSTFLTLVSLVDTQGRSVSSWVPPLRWHCFRYDIQEYISCNKRSRILLSSLLSRSRTDHLEIFHTEASDEPTGFVTMTPATRKNDHLSQHPRTLHPQLWPLRTLDHQNKVLFPQHHQGNPLYPLHHQ